ncbi:MAG: hypothetical protein ACK4K7_02810 [Allosphingosinicella sp.]|uniref:hypothetical protein n=1 Tax=Allosphingosinicella sp. TaxID=2823234 RepID=UPI0039229C4C
MGGRGFVAALGAVCLGCAAAGAQPSEPVPEAVAAMAPAEACCTLPARTPILIEVLEPVSSRTARPGDGFSFRLVEPVTVDGRILIPAGALGTGEVVHAARGGLAGKAGELILAARFLELGDQRIALRSLRFGDRQGADRTTATLVASMLPYAGLLAPLIVGGNIEVPAGTQAGAMIAADIVLPPHADTPTVTQTGERE